MRADYPRLAGPTPRPSPHIWWSGWQRPSTPRPPRDDSAKVLGYALVLVISGCIVIGQLRAQRRCERNGGHYVKTFTGFACIK